MNSRKQVVTLLVLLSLTTLGGTASAQQAPVSAPSTELDPVPQYVILPKVGTVAQMNRRVKIAEALIFTGIPVSALGGIISAVGYKKSGDCEEFAPKNAPPCTAADHAEARALEISGDVVMGAGVATALTGFALVVANMAQMKRVKLAPDGTPEARGSDSAPRPSVFVAPVVTGQEVGIVAAGTF